MPAGAEEAFAAADGRFAATGPPSMPPVRSGPRRGGNGTRPAMRGRVITAPTCAIVRHTPQPGCGGCAVVLMVSGLFLPILGELAGQGRRRAVCGAEEAGCVIVLGAEIDWDEPGRYLYDRTHAEL